MCLMHTQLDGVGMKSAYRPGVTSRIEKVEVDDLAASIRELEYAYRLKRSEQALSHGEFTSATVAEAVLAVWRRRPHLA